MEKDVIAYEEYLKQKQLSHESLCTRCGCCCGAFDGDPCEHLFLDSNKKYYCDIYENRFGTRKTVSGKTFQCMPIRDILFESSWADNKHCAYRKILNNKLI